MIASILFSNCSTAAIFDWKMDLKARSVVGAPKRLQADMGRTAMEGKDTEKGQ